jgi:hypothetical protein
MATIDANMTLVAKGRDRISTRLVPSSAGLAGEQRYYGDEYEIRLVEDIRAITLISPNIPFWETRSLRHFATGGAACGWPPV